MQRIFVSVCMRLCVCACKYVNACERPYVHERACMRARGCVKCARVCVCVCVCVTKCVCICSKSMQDVFHVCGPLITHAGSSTQLKHIKQRSQPAAHEAMGGCCGALLTGNAALNFSWLGDALEFLLICCL